MLAGFLHCSTCVTKTFGADVGLVGSDVVDDIGGDADFAATLTGAIPSEGAHDAKRAWRNTVAGLWHARRSMATSRWISRSSLVGLLKANIDTLEPVLGRDPNGRLTFCPLDDKVTSLIARRTQGDAPALEVRVRRV